MPRRNTPHALKGQLNQMRDLYENSRLSLKEIANRLGVSKQAVHQRLTRAGVKMRPRGQELHWRAGKSRRKVLDRDAIFDLYVTRGLIAREIAERIGCKVGMVYRSLEWHGIPRRQRKYPQLERLNVGESIVVPRPRHRGKHQTAFYGMAKLLGIRLSVKTLDEKSVQLTRVK